MDQRSRGLKMIITAIETFLLNCSRKPGGASIGVAHVPQSFKYQSLLGLAETASAHDHFGQIVDSDGTVLLCLNEWGAHEHPALTSPHHAKPGNGLLLFFRLDNFD
jgi:hypothetical protein